MIHFVWLNSTLSTPFRPSFEIIYALEVCALALLLLLIPFAAVGISLANPIHRNFRIVFLLALLHMTIGTCSRITIIYHQLFSEGTYSTSLTVASICRAMFFAFFMLFPWTVSVERFLATMWWEWYERQKLSTLAVFLSCCLFIELGVVIPAICVVYEVYSLPVQMVLFATYLSVGTATFFYLLNRNEASQASLTARRISTRYTVSKHYQIKENLLVFRMLRNIAIQSTASAVPAFVFFSLYLFIPSGLCDFLKLFSVALFDLHISLYNLGLLYRVCTCDRRFTRGMRIAFLGRRVCRDVQPEQTMSHVKEEQDEGDFYFSQLAGDLAGPHTT